MIDFKEYNKHYDPCMLSVVEESINIFETQEEFRKWIEVKWVVNKIEEVTFRSGGKGKRYSLDNIDHSISNMKVMFLDCNSLHFSDPSCAIEGAFYVCDQLRKDFPELEGKLIFVDTYGEIARFPFECSDDELCRRIGLDGEFYDHKLMQQFGFE
ncbi:hypothetical protein [Pseudovibrio sp. Ad26]|uniref:hypothetical protein n=1 Tax=Pseudovibrio sp. Ad26 TaxID=989410 RepID=UPI0007AED6D5|nr:hypothetical protein [Pseudovibrio sp. Ad26]KZL15700.1 hypothetical protein PsAD26_00925 [Pseudovibrio sp. Ad26]